MNTRVIVNLSWLEARAIMAEITKPGFLESIRDPALVERLRSATEALRIEIERQRKQWNLGDDGHARPRGKRGNK